MEIWSDLIVPVGKREGFNNMIGKSNNPINLDKIHNSSGNSVSNI